MNEPESPGQPAAPSPAPASVTGRTPYDAATEILKDVLVLLGRAAPYVVVVALAVFGAYKFVELERSKLDAIREARTKALEENAETIRRLKDQILQDAGTITSLHSSNVDVIVKQIEAQQKVAAIITESTARIAELTEESVRFNADIAEKEARQKALAEEIAASAARFEAIEARAGELERTAHVAAHLIEVLSNPATFVPTSNLWQIAERYEGGSADHVGRDYAGVFYYGIFRIRGGAEMGAFVEYLKGKDPFTARALETASAEGAESGAFGFVTQWQNLAKRPEFGDLQRTYISDNDYAATEKKCKFQGRLNLAERSIAFQSVMWAATVQHGPARAGDFCMALRDESETLDDMALIERIYALRHAAIDRDFGDQDPLIRRLLRVRYDLEKKDAFKILEEIDHQS